MKKHLSTILLIFIFFVGLAVLLYPSISNIYNDSLHVTEINSYENIIQEMEPEDYEELWQIADEYNARVGSHGTAMYFINGDPQGEDYKKALNVNGTSLFGYIEIPKINVTLPLYHGTGEAVLAAGVGHLEGSALPGGGPSTHCILSGHRGLPSARLFTDLDQMEIGDQVILSILNQTLLYEVDQIVTVLPNDISHLQIEEDEEYLTLLTCTPYGINSHRLLVRAKRIYIAEEDKDTTLQVIVRKDAELYSVAVIAPIAAVPMAFVMLVFLIRYFKRREFWE